MPARMDGGYINEGGQLKTKNGQKYIINEKPDGFFITKSCAVLLGLMAILALAAVFLLTYFLILPRCDGNDVIQHNETISSASILGGSPSISNGNSFANGNDGVVADQGNVIKDDEFVLHEGWNPIRYKLIIEPNFEESINNGSVSIEMINDPKINGIQPIVLDINNIEILDVEAVNVDDNTTIPVEKSYGKNNSTFIIILKNDFKKVTTLRLRLQLTFVSVLTDTLQGFYKVTYSDELNGKSSTLASTQFSPIDARRAFPCFDRPDKKAEFDISIVRPYDKTMVLSNMPHVHSSDYRPGYIKDDFEKTPKMSTYLVAFIVSNLVESNVSVPLNYDMPRIRAWSRPEVADMTGFAIKMTNDILPYLEHYFDLKFKLRKIDMVAVPDFGFSAMENWGLITFRESAILVPEDKERRSSAEHTERVASIIAHELAHQWFGNLVTPKWWDDLWLKEGFATYMSYLALQSIEPTWRYMDFFGIFELQKSMEKDSDESSHPISFGVSKPSDIRRIFDPISYSKGASVIRMMNSFLGEQAFKFAIKMYLRKFMHSNAVQDDLWYIMSEFGHKYKTLPMDLQVKEIMDTWTLQAGYPVLNVKRNGSDIIITQQRYMLPEMNKNDKSRWFIPITYGKQFAAASSEIPTEWMTNKDDQIVLRNVVRDDEWFYLNVNRTGYYRVNYDYASFALFSRTFQQLPEIVRAQLIDDSLHLARAGYMGYDIPLTFLMRISLNHNDVLSWAAVGEGLEYLTYMLTREPAYESFKAVMRYISTPAYTHFEFDERDDEDHVQLMHRARIVKTACYYGNDRCTNRAQVLFRDWMRDKRQNNIRPNLKDTIYCIALREGGIQEWNFAYKQYLETTSASEKETLLNALGCTTKPWLLAKYLNMTINSSLGIRKQDGSRAFSSVARNSVGHEIAFDFLVSNIEEISKYFGDGFSTLAKMIDSATTYMNKEHHLEQFERFAAKAKKLNLKAIEKSIELAIEQVKNNIFWRSQFYYKLQTYLEKLMIDFHINMY